LGGAVEITTCGVTAQVESDGELATGIAMVSDDQQHSPAILQVFNRYLHYGGEEKVEQEIFELLSGKFSAQRLLFDSADWIGEHAPTKISQAYRILYNRASINALNRAIDSQGSDVLLFSNIIPVGSLGLYRAAAKRGVPVVQIIHNYRPFSPGATLWVDGRIVDDALRGNCRMEVLHGAWQGSRIKTAWLALMLKIARRLGWFDSVTLWIAISEFVRQRFISAGIAPSRIVTIRHMHKFDCLPPVDRVAASNGEYYLILARLTEEKGVEVALDAWEILESRLGSACPRLEICGSGPREDAIQTRCRGMRSVTFCGSVAGEIKAKKIARCRAMVAPSLWWEPLGLVAYEGYEYSRPMLAAASGGLTETVEHGRTGYLHEPGNAEDLVSHIVKFEADPDSLRVMGENGRCWLVENASESVWLGKFADALKSATS
jgi:glycosyltransferase involved in cell wall biosynthesis